jgi:hypothetical protein
MSMWKWNRGRLAWTKWNDGGSVITLDERIVHVDGSGVTETHERWVRVVFGLWLRCRQ